MPTTTVQIDLAANPELANCEEGEELMAVVTGNDGTTLTVDLTKEYEEEEDEMEESMPMPMKGKKKVAPAVAVILAKGK